MRILRSFSLIFCVAAAVVASGVSPATATIIDLNPPIPRDGKDLCQFDTGQLAAGTLNSIRDQVAQHPSARNLVALRELDAALIDGDTLENRALVPRDARPRGASKRKERDFEPVRRSVKRRVQALSPLVQAPEIEAPQIAVEINDAPAAGLEAPRESGRRPRYFTFDPRHVAMSRASQPLFKR